MHHTPKYCKTNLWWLGMDDPHKYLERQKKCSSLSLDLTPLFNSDKGPVKLNVPCFFWDTTVKENSRRGAVFHENLNRVWRVNRKWETAERFSPQCHQSNFRSSWFLCSRGNKDFYQDIYQKFHFRQIPAVLVCINVFFFVSIFFSSYKFKKQ